MGYYKLNDEYFYRTKVSFLILKRMCYCNSCDFAIEKELSSKITNTKYLMTIYFFFNNTIYLLFLLQNCVALINNFKSINFIRNLSIIINRIYQIRFPACESTIYIAITYTCKKLRTYLSTS